jgi:hypothetical protein
LDAAAVAVAGETFGAGEDALEWVLAGLSGGRYGELNVHELRPRGVGVDAEDLNSIGNTLLDLVDAVVQAGHNDQHGGDGDDGKARGDAN